MWRNGRDFAEIPTKKGWWCMLQTRQLSLFPLPPPFSSPFPPTEQWGLVGAHCPASHELSCILSSCSSLLRTRSESWRNFPFRRAQYGILRTFGRIPIWDVLPFWIWYLLWEIVCESLRQSDCCSDSGTLAMMCHVSMRWPLTSVMCLDIRLHSSAGLWNAL